ncbi:MAG: AzlD domain-containing protein [Clostridia bacterium]|nr:AzlD domain-containing protein [Clostridia bacterium]
MDFDAFLPYLITMALVTYFIRAVPLVLFKKKIENRFALSFLHYMPYAVLSVMTVPAVFFATDHVLSAAAGVAAALVLALMKRSLILVAVGASAGVFIAELAIRAVGG